jgi:FKBP-type peptidyl-prolyl cis-trans isomerase FkpA
MKKRGWLVMGIAGVALLASVPGCEGLQDPPKPSPIATAPPPPPDDPIPDDLEPKQAPFPKLPSGAGQIDADAPEELTPTSSGLYYRILRKSDGRKPKASDSVLADYHGTLADGTLFDSSYESGKPIEFSLTRVIKGWTEGLQLIGEGGMIELEIPYQLAYGAAGRQPKIPPKATLHFLVELKEIK